MRATKTIKSTENKFAKYMRLLSVVENGFLVPFDKLEKTLILSENVVFC